MSIVLEKAKVKVVCKGCGKEPHEILEYRQLASIGEYESAEEAVVLGEGTYNRGNGKFYCTSCYIKAGMPSGVAK